MTARAIVIVLALVLAAGLVACASSGGSGYRTSARVYGGYYGPRPYGYYGYNPVVVVPPGPDIGGPVATPLPAMEPDFGDFGPVAGFDDF